MHLSGNHCKSRRLFTSSKKSFAILAIIVGATGIGIGVYSIATVASTLGQTDVPTESLSNTQESHHLVSSDFPSLGGPDASVTIVEYGDYQCRDCQRFAVQIKPLVIENYINNGKAKLIFKDFTIHGSDSVNGALAAHCAGDQDKFWEMHDLMYQKQEGINSGWLSIDNIRKLASETDLDMREFNSCFDGRKYVEKISEGLNDGKTLDVNGTPTFIIIDGNGGMVALRGAGDFGMFEQVLDTMLEN